LGNSGPAKTRVHLIIGGKKRWGGTYTPQEGFEMKKGACPRKWSGWVIFSGRPLGQQKNNGAATASKTDRTNSGRWKGDRTKVKGGKEETQNNTRSKKIEMDKLVVRGSSPA